MKVLYKVEIFLREYTNINDPKILRKYLVYSYNIYEFIKFLSFHNYFELSFTLDKAINHKPCINSCQIKDSSDFLPRRNF